MKYLHKKEINHKIDLNHQGTILKSCNLAIIVHTLPIKSREKVLLNQGIMSLLQRWNSKAKLNTNKNLFPNKAHKDFAHHQENNMYLIQLHLMETQPTQDNSHPKGLKVHLLFEDKKLTINQLLSRYRAAQHIKINTLQNKFSQIVISLQVLKNTILILPNFKGKPDIAR